MVNGTVCIPKREKVYRGEATSASIVIKTSKKANGGDHDFQIIDHTLLVLRKGRKQTLLNQQGGCLCPIETSNTTRREKKKDIVYYVVQVGWKGGGGLNGDKQPVVTRGGKIVPDRGREVEGRRVGKRRCGKGRARKKREVRQIACVGIFHQGKKGGKPLARGRR